MDTSQIAYLRFYQQGLTDPRFSTPAEVVAWNGALQSQDYAGAKWAVAQRIRGNVTDSTLDQAYDSGAILRTHLMRPTWHFVTPEDIRWLLKLTAPRVHAANAYYYRTLGLDKRIFVQSATAMAKALEGGVYLKRSELAAVLRQAGINAGDLRLSYLVMHAELESLICSGPRRGKQFTYALLDERVRPTKPHGEDEAIARLTTRYFVSHGPALLKDFAWWSGLTINQAKEGIELVKHELHQERIHGQTYWLSATPPPAKSSTPSAHLLPNYDEAIASYKEYSAASAPRFENAWANGNTLFSHYLVIDGWVVGTWKRRLTRSSVLIDSKAFEPFTPAQSHALSDAAQGYGAFLGLNVEMTEVR